MGLGKPRRRQRRTSTFEGCRSHECEVTGEGDAEQAAQVISDTVAGLVRVARQHNLDLLSYLLSMTRLEAEEQIKRSRRRKLS
jgi:acid stress-induced BolA-like protein IbaG/YrbA